MDVSDDAKVETFCPGDSYVTRSIGLEGGGMRRGKRSLSAIRGFWCLACFFALAGGPTTARAGADEPRAVSAVQVASERAPRAVPRASSSVHVDGLLDDAAWSRALVIDLPYEIEPGDNVPAPVATECLLTFDEQNFYAAFRAGDPRPDEIRAHLSDRDAAFRDDFVGLMIDPFNDERRGFEFFVNPFGVQMDLARNDMADDDPEDSTWDAIWNTAGRITADGYEVEIAIPFTALRFPRTDGPQVWGLVAFRARPRSVRYQISSVTFDRDVSGFFRQAGKIVGFEGITPGRNIELDPTVTGQRTDAVGSSGHLRKEDQKADAGLSARWGITPNLCLNAAVNPDFSQVEADAVQLEVNNRFALQYAEKRPLFLEGSDFFATPLQTVYTRTVVDPSWGAKVTGKLAGSAVGLFVTRDDHPNLIFPSNLSSDGAALDLKVTSGVLRYRRDVGSASAIGVLATDREGDSYHNRVYGFDGHIRIGKGDLIRYQAVGSATRYPEATAAAYGQPARAFGGFGGSLLYSHDRRGWSGWYYGENLDQNFRADAGFVPRVDVRHHELGAQRHIYGAKESWFTRLNYGVEAQRTTNMGGEVTDSGIEISGSYQGPMQSESDAQFTIARERYLGRLYDVTTGRFHVEGQPVGAFKGWFTAWAGKAIDYTNARPARDLSGGPGFQWNVGHHLSMTIDHTYQRLSEAGETLYEVNLIDSRFVYQFNIRTYARAIVQYEDLILNTGLYDPAMDMQPRSRALFGQLLLSYKVNPQTVVYLGYSGNHAGSRVRGLRPEDRTIFMKLGYAWLV
jgi:hypothetical protein